MKLNEVKSKLKPYDYGNGLTIEDICDVVVEIEKDKSKYSGEW